MVQNFSFFSEILPILDGVFTPAEIDAIIELAEILGLPESVYAEVLAETFRDGFIPIIPTNR